MVSMDIGSILALASSALISYNNSTAVTGPMITMGVRRIAARILAGVSISIGAITLGWAMRTPSQCGSMDTLGAYIALLAPMILSTYLGIPFSASIALIGAGVGRSYVLRSLDRAWLVDTSMLWVISTILTISMGYTLYIAMEKIIGRTRGVTALLSVSRPASILISITMGLLLGGNTLGFLSSLECHRGLAIIALGGLAASLPGSSLIEGIFRWFSTRHLSTLAIQISSAVSIIIATFLGLPLSHVYAIILSAVGYSTSSGISIYSRRQILKLIRTWICSLLVGFAASAALTALITHRTA